MKAKYDYRKRRKALGLTLAQVAKKADLTTAAVCMFEAGSINGKMETRRRLAAALDISPRLLMTDLEQQTAFGDARKVGKLQGFIEAEKIPQDKALEVLKSWADLQARKRG